ncbi:Kef-type potassium/proton antiporter accessory protein, CPA2 family [Syntrophus gentianae]|uniref:Kef-type potassium/proton antiporter accessory protein, CPA2 family n=1 Tax=Syntrophus gentianae TaxID=43775 RepID=A0A1H7ZCN0_9BACT|nr:NAD(P)H-dependent oxidoreductase [Syntrophus gentianae]SEM55259.1 Kef-type potassium/proton antiporter accessory protein, CPA2 family [Syntrophus gentianae]
MNRILILFAHPRFENSRVNRALLKDIWGHPAVTLNDLYELYPDFNIDVEREKARLTEHQVLVWQHPIYMYSAPALLKQWIDLVLEHGWAHGEGGDVLRNKWIFNAISSGGTRNEYAPDGFNRFTMGEFLIPFQQTATLCRMIYLPPFAVQGTYRLMNSDLEHYAALYRTLLDRLAQGNLDIESARTFPFLNDWLLSEAGDKP